MEIDNNILRILTALIESNTIEYYRIDIKYVNVFCPGASFRIVKRGDDREILKEESPKDSEELLK